MAIARPNASEERLRLLLNRANRKHDEIYKHSRIPEYAPAFRILTLYPGDGNDELYGTLQVHKLDRWLPRYTAISYCWGDVALNEGNGFSLVIDGTQLPITQNAYRTLRNIRSPSRRKRIWIDQVCIDQTNIEERADQIRIMGQIYRRSIRVLAYLGEEFENVDFLFKFLRLGAAEARAEKSTLLRQNHKLPIPSSSPLYEHFIQGKKLYPSTIRGLEQLANQISEFRDALDTFLSLQWFSRIWIVQEAALGRELFLQVGQHVVRFEGLISINSWLAYSRELRLLPGEAVAGYKTTAAVQLLRYELHQRRTLKVVLREVVEQLKKFCRSPSKNGMTQILRPLSFTVYLPMLHLLREFRHQACTDYRDKLWGIAGMSDPGQGYGYLDKLPLFENSLVSSLFFARVHILITGTLDVLSASCCTGPAWDSLPYWCPDWSQRAPECDTKFCIGTYEDAPHRAGLRRPAKYLNFEDPRNAAIVIEGFQIDEVSEVVEGGPTVSNYANPKDKVWQEWTNFALKQPSSDTVIAYGTDEERWEAYWRTLVYNCNGADGVPKPSLGQAMRRFLLDGKEGWESHLMTTIIRKDANGVPEEVLGEGQRKFLYSDDPSTREDYAAEVTGRLVWPCRKLYRTKRGYLGNGCSNVKPGDKVVIGHGGRFPFLMREHKVVTGVVRDTSGGYPHGKHEYGFQGHQLIGGDTYVHGLSDGEAFDIAEREDIKPRYFCLT